jgi:hypothetical protein
MDCYETTRSFTTRAETRRPESIGEGSAVMHIRDGKIAETWIHVDDQDALDELLCRPNSTSD